jgi:predicted PurR-regulated permease PerM
VTTKALDEAASRVSRYLIAQLGINLVFGALAAIGLYLTGVSNALLWGMFACVVRYVPYLGIWIAAIMPAGVEFAVDPDGSRSSLFLRSILERMFSY